MKLNKEICGMYGLLLVILLFVFDGGTLAFAFDNNGPYTLRFNNGSAPLRISSLTSIDVAVENVPFKHNLPQIQLGVTEYDENTKVRWYYSFRYLGVGDQITFNGIVYRVDSMHYTDTQTTSRSNSKSNLDNQGSILPPVGGCYPHCLDFIKIVWVGGNLAEENNKSTITLVDSSSFSVIIGDTYLLDVNLDSVKIDSVGEIHANIEWRDHINSLDDSIAGQPAKPPKHLIVGVGDVIDLPVVGHFLVKSILPATSSHADWVILAPEK
ncbi:hypothetical protein [Rhodanobacter sp. C05]|uniref:hypothetical protein n=1 Tax=Rhodanobacter sp. C05 TaxID=1945855 RepID=UPI00117ABE79|nr:hypothetical protein [Rhodanobacter sp. C05]